MQKKRVLAVDNDPQGNLTSAIFGDEISVNILPSAQVASNNLGVSNVYRAY